MSKITISPAALFQIIRDVKMGPSQDTQGRLYGMPSDGEGSPIEVTHAFPDYSRKELGRQTGEQNTSNDEDVKNFARAHLKRVKQLNFDGENVGWYTSRNCGRRMAFKDITDQQEYQKEESSYFCLVVDLSQSSLSLRAFRINEQAMQFLQGKSTAKDIFPVIDETMYFDNLLQEYEVSFCLSPLDQVITTEILSSFNLIADVFRIRDPSTFDKNVTTVADSIDSIEKDLKEFTTEKHKIRNNAKERDSWLKERRANNKKREAKGLPPLPEDEVDIVHPLTQPSNKIDVISQIYQYNANSAALHQELDEEITKIEALVNLGTEEQK